MTITINGSGTITGLSAGGLPDATIATADIIDANVTQAKLATGVGATGPAFYGYLNQTQAFTGGTYVKVQLNGESFDTASCFNNTGSTVGGIPAYAFLPNVAGYYQINAQVANVLSTYSGDNIIAVYKNGTLYTRAYVGTYGIPNISNLVYLNGSTDYLELYFAVGTSQNVVASSALNYLSGALVRAA